MQPMITATEVVAKAEADLKIALVSGTASDISKAEDALVAARRAAAEGVERAATRQRLQNELDADGRAREKARRQQLADEAVDALADEAPVVVLKYRNVTISVPVGLGDHVARQTCRQDLRKAIELLDIRFADHVIATWNCIVSGVEPPQEYVDVRFFDYLQDTMRRTIGRGLVTVEVGAEETV